MDVLPGGDGSRRGTTPLGRSRLIAYSAAGAFFCTCAVLVAAYGFSQPQSTPPAATATPNASVPQAAPPPAPAPVAPLPSAAATPSVAPARTAAPAPSRATSAVPAATLAATPGDSSRPLAGRVVVIDPGHNGANAQHLAEIRRQVDGGGFQKDCNTTGTAAGGLTESAFNLSAALLLKSRLEALGAQVTLTRTDDQGWGPCVDSRGLLATQVGADLLVSVHADGATADEAGFHVIAPGVRAGYTDRTAGPSLRLAGFVRDELVRAGLRTSTYLGREGIDVRTDLGTLNRAGVPSVMLEAGNMHNGDDLALLRSEAGQLQIADAITRAVTTFLS